MTYTGGGVWKAIQIPTQLDNLSSVKKQRYIKLHPDEILSENVTGKKYDYTFYIDGSLRITCDIKPLVYSLIEDGRKIAIHNHYCRNCLYVEAAACVYMKKLQYNEAIQQIQAYKREGFPENFGLFETPVIIRKCNDSKLASVMQDWWQEIERYTHRDQLSLTYVLWKNGLDCSYIFSLGNNVWENPYFMYYPHNHTL